MTGSFTQPEIEVFVAMANGAPVNTLDLPARLVFGLRSIENQFWATRRGMRGQS